MSDAAANPIYVFVLMSFIRNWIRKWIMGIMRRERYGNNTRTLMSERMTMDGCHELFGISSFSKRDGIGHASCPSLDVDARRETLPLTDIANV
jgi:hypothetical protein